MSIVRDLLLLSEVLVQRKTGKQTGPFRLLLVYSENYIINLPSSPIVFRLIVIKPYYIDNINSNEPIATKPIDTKLITLVGNTPKVKSLLLAMSILPLKRGRGRLRKYALQLTSFPNIKVFIGIETLPTLQFTASRQKEINGLIKHGVYILVLLVDIPDSIRVFSSRFINEIKNPSIDKAFKKLRLVI